MNLYVRYFDAEVLVESLDEVLQFLGSIDDIELTDQLVNDIAHFVNSPVRYPKRYKVRSKVYFIIIKTEAKSMEEFKSNNKKNRNEDARAEAKKTPKPVVLPEEEPTVSSVVGSVMAKVIKEENIFDNSYNSLFSERPGWYEGKLNFKRIVTMPSGKCRTVDQLFVARCKAISGQDCYDRIVDFLLEQVDRRSQFPSPKGNNFQFRYLGMWREEAV